MGCVYGTGKNMVDQVGKTGLSGNIIPDAWYKTIISRNGKVNLLAVNILADVVYWYRPSEMRDEITGKVTYKKKFRHVDFLQKSYKDICEKFNCSEKQAREALKDLENLGVVTRHFKTVETEYGFYPNAMFLELIPGALIALTFPEDEKNDNDSGRGNTCCPTGKHTLPQKETGISEIGNTYTENNTEISTKISTTIPDADVSIVEKAKDIFREYDLPPSDIRSILKAAGNDLSKCRIAKDLLKLQSNKILNKTGWLINAIKKDYKPNPRASDQDKGSFFRFQKRNDYDFEALKSSLVVN
jgi:hypothetical protein